MHCNTYGFQLLDTKIEIRYIGSVRGCPRKDTFATIIHMKSCFVAPGAFDWLRNDEDEEGLGGRSVIERERAT